jgi:nuclear pore complex protein Nup54
MSSIFGNANNNNQQPSQGLFGSTTPSGGLFSNTTQNNTSSGGSGGGLFSGLGTNNNNGNSTQNTGSTSIFGSSTTNNNATGTGSGGLFPSGTNNSATSGGTGLGGLFGGSTNNQQQAQPSNSLFGGNSNTQNNAGTSLFGNTANTGSNNTTTSAFGTQNKPEGMSMFGTALGGQQQQQQNQPQSGSIFNPTTVTVGSMNHSMTTAQYQRLQFSGHSTVPNEKRIADQVMTLQAKWNPDNAPDQPITTILKTYLYNAVPKEYAPFFYPDTSRGEDEKSWEEALSQKPEPPKVDGQEAPNIAYVPVLVKGFKALAGRVETQANTIKEMRKRLHEMNNSLTAVMDAHQQRITVRIATAKRQHQVLSQRCLRLAVKVQVLRNRGYALDASEENLRKTLMGLEKQVFDPAFVGREDEIWARMVALRERMRWLEEEGKRVAAQADDAQKANGGTGLSEDVLVRARKILKDYDEQLQHLNKELEDVKTEFSVWEQSQRR